MHKHKNFVKNVVGISAGFSSSAVVGHVIETLVPMANLTPFGRAVHLIGRFFVGGAVGAKVEKYAREFVDDAYETCDNMQ